MRSDDEVLVTRCLEGDQPAFAFLVNKYKEVVHAYAYRKVGDYQQAEDITQEVFIKAYRNLAQLKLPHRFQSWLYTIASNECKMWLRKHSNGSKQVISWEDMSSEELDELAVRNHSDEDVELTVKNAMEALPDDRQLVLSLFYMSSMSIKEIAYFMGVSPNSIGIKLHRARKQLGERMEKMIGNHLNKEKLKAGFVFKIAESIKNMPIPSLPRPHPIKWALPISIGMALIMGIIGFGVSTGRDIPKDIPVLKFTEGPVEVSLVDEELEAKSSGENELLASNTEDSIAPEAEGNYHKEIVVRKIGFKEPIHGDDIYPSPDGRYLSFSGKNGNLAILDLTTGESRELTDEGTWEGPFRHTNNSTWSPDGKQIAYDWYNEGTAELRVVGLDGSKPRVLHPGEESRGRISGCYDWSQDGKYIITWLEDLQSIGLIPVDGGPTRIIKSPERCPPETVTLSPDSRYVVYERPVKEHGDLNDIFLLATDGSGEETRLTEHPANDDWPIWSPDGKNIVFASNRTPDGTVGLWLMQIVDGKPAGEPQLVKREAGVIASLGFTEKGSLFYITINNWSDIYVTSVDMETGEVLSTPELLPSQGFNTMPAWSPDGESLAYESRRTVPGSFRDRPALMIRSMKTGEERELIPDQDIAIWGRLGQLRWSPDGHSILCGGDPGGNLHLIDVQTGHVTANVATRNCGYIQGPAWSPDGKTIFFTRIRCEKEDWPCSMVALNLETGVERELYPGGSRESFLAVSPDGRQLAFIDKDGMIKAIPTEGGEPRALLNMKDLLGETGYSSGPFAWTPDGRYLLFVTGPLYKQADSMVQLWRISAEGGIPQKLLEEREMLYPLDVYPLSLHPDGRRIAFQKGKELHRDLWVMENLLPTSTARR